MIAYAATEDDTIVVARAALERLGSYDAVLAHFAAADFAVPPPRIEGDVADAIDAAAASSTTSIHGEGS